ncbi:B12-binding domain-containing radical SAM protein [bacterium]|nr:B12-binding domain-containing radical SAM protein [bacterium]MBU1152403.1 B12-binding domain-containing radical SAM protein [bacterium]MBU2599963.1 B12-binding domain-containing radical SAM protein [bacterium]
MKILIINPPRLNGINVRRDERSVDILEDEVSPFYQGAALAQWLRVKNLALVKVLDANGLNLDYGRVNLWLKENKDARFVVVKGGDDTLYHDSITCTLAKHLGLTTIFWEPILSPAMPERVMQNLVDIDYLVLGEAELTISELLEKGNQAKGIAYREEDQIKISPRLETERLKDIDSLPIPNFNDLPYQNYKAWFGESPWMTIFTSRGCVGTCFYCLIGGNTCFRGYGRKLRLMGVHRVVEELEVLVKKYNIPHITFWDDCFTNDLVRVEDICHQILTKNLKFRWSCMSRVDRIDKKLLSLMKKAGLSRIGFGIESGNQRVLDSIPKRITAEENIKTPLLAKSLGIWVWIFLLLGLPEEDERSMQDTINTLKKIRPHHLCCGTATPFPGTKFYEVCLKENLLKSDIFDLITAGLQTGGGQISDTRYVKAEVVNQYLKKLHETANIYSENKLHNMIQKLKPFIPKFMRDTLKNILERTRSN